MKKKFNSILTLLLRVSSTLLVVPCAHAQMGRGVNEVYEDVTKGAQTIQSLGVDMFGDQTNMIDGSTVFTVVDVAAKPNSGLPMSVGRKLAINARHLDSHGGGMDPAKEIFGNYWDLDVPYMRGTFAAETGWVSSIPGHRCRDPDIAPRGVYGIGHFNNIYYESKDYWSGNRINIPGYGEEDLLGLPEDHQRPDDGRVYYGATKSDWRVSCVDTVAGEGYLVTLPNGVSYRFDWLVTRSSSSIEDWSCRVGFYGQPCYSGISLPRSEVTLYATLVTDRFGNWVSYDYDPINPHRLRSISSNDGALIDLSYHSNGKIASITHGDSSWSYVYGSNNQLTDVIRPDSSHWTYVYNNLVNVVLNHQNLWGGCNVDSNVGTRKSSVAPSAGDIASLVITHPSGATGDFRFRKIIHGTSYTPGYCHWRVVRIGTPPITHEYAEMEGVPMAYQVVSIYEKKIAGPGLTPMSWTYKYEPSWSWSYNNYCALPRTCSRISKTVVTSTDGTVMRYGFSNEYQVNPGKMLELKIEKDGTVRSTTSHTYLASAVGHPFKNAAGNNRHGRANTFTYFNRPLLSTTIVQDGVSFSSSVNTYDVFPRPVSVTKSNSLGYGRTEVTEYHDDLVAWVLGQPRRRYIPDSNINADPIQIGSVVPSEIHFNAQSLPWKIYSFGKLLQSITYNTDGTVATVADGRDSITTYSSWKRGIPRQIRSPATPGEPTGATRSVIVDDNGWITAVTDENEYTHGYGYDAMGRLASIVYPNGSNDAWTPKGFEFRPVTVSDWLPPGISAGQWRHYEGQGDYAKFTYFDAMWRPVLVLEYDTSNVAPTVRYTRTAYDSNGRVNFQSYPVADPATTTTTGIRTFYDALDRVTSVQQDSEHGVLTTKTEYLAGLQVRVTNPRDLPTTTGFMAWDQPSYDLPLWSSQPEGKVIEISRHPQFGWPLQLKQRSADNSLQASRQYVYDGNAQLCKTIEPETGASVMGYDAAGNLAWQVSGLPASSFNSTNDCQHMAAAGTGLAVGRAYDNRNRLTHLTFPDGKGNQIWTYEKDNLPASVTAYNGTGNTDPVVTAYSYNKRRLLTGESLSQPSYTWGIGYEYDSIGNLRWQSYPTGLKLDFAPNALGQATQARNANQSFIYYASGAQYFPNGALKQFTYGNGIVHTMTQNARQLPARVTSSGNVLDFGYKYDKNANPTAILDYVTGTPTTQHRWMTYDGLDRLITSASAMYGGSDHTHRFTYDALDNIESWKHAGVKDYADYVYDPQNRLTNIRNTAGASVVGIGYDPQGNLANKNGQAYDFDYGNRLRNVPGKEWYRYDGLGRRVQTTKSDDSQTTLWQYGQAGQMLFSTDWDGSNYLNQKTHEYVYLAGSVIATIDHAWPSNAVIATKYQHTDALGSPVALTNEAGAVIERNNYEPYGAIIGNPTRSGIGYTGHVMDGATGLTYMQQRYYDQSMGRFLSVDPVTAVGGDSRHFNRYNYAYGNPYRFIDPDGRAPPGCGDGTCQSYDQRMEQINNIVIASVGAMAISADGIDAGEEFFISAIFLKLAGGIAGSSSRTKATPVTGRTQLNQAPRAAVGNLPTMARYISPQKQRRHIAGTAANDKSYMASMADAQAVLDAYRSGRFTLVARSASKDSITIKVDGVTGTYVNRGNQNGKPDIEAPTNVFMIQSFTNPKVVPVNPGKNQ